MTIRAIKLLRVAEGEDGGRWAAALAHGEWLRGAAVLKEDGGSWVRRATILGRDVVVKCRPLSSVRRRIQSWLRRGHGDRHWRGADLLASRRIATASPLLLVRASVDGLACEVLVLTLVRGPNLLECMRLVSRNEMPIKRQHALAKAAGEHLAAFGMGGLRNRDHKPSNLIVTNIENGPIEIAVIDCIAVTSRLVPLKYARMLASMIIEPSGCGVLPRRSLIARGLVAMNQAMLAGLSSNFEMPFAPKQGRRNTWRYVASIVEAHGGPTPKVNPLVHAE